MNEARHKRAMGEYKELTDIIDELEENSLAQKASATLPLNAVPPQGQEFDLESMPPLTYYLLLQKLRQRKSFILYFSQAHTAYTLCRVEMVA